ncbi:MAG TPA: methionyl-tRNA formyltransferase [Polyangiaceae bacterium]|nr:methionyl-tRNA formyltransferase [Polyangiaceae bacterium]
MRTIFLGTPEIAVPALEALAATTDLVGVVCQPDRPKGRGLAVTEPPVKVAARSLGIHAHQPVKVKTGNLDEWIAALEPDVAVVLAYGRILPPKVLAAPKHGCMNLHASLLPHYRGAAPIQWAIMNGETETGISLMQMDEGLDTGDVYTMRRIPIRPDDDGGSLSAKIAELAAIVVREDLARAVRGELPRVPQDSAAATYAPPLTREHGKIDWARQSARVVDQVRGLSPRPAAFTALAGRTLKVLAASVGPPLDGAATAKPGTVIRADRGGLWIASSDRAVIIQRAQVEGKKAMSGTDLVNGRAVRLNDVLGS